MRTMLSIVISTSGCVLILSAALSLVGVPLDETALDSFQGGNDKWCAAFQHDEAAIDCNECVPNGNGGSVRCDTTSTNDTWLYVEGQTPAQHWEEYTTPCGGNLETWSGLGCTGTLTITENGCNRDFNKWRFIGSSFAVNCPPL